MFLTPDTSNEIHKIYLGTEMLCSVVEFLFIDPERVTSKEIKWANVYLHNLKDIDIINPRKPNYSPLVTQMMRRIKGQTERLETLYESVADITDKENDK